jgi:hypothetical protein
MSGPLLHQGATVTCQHAGQAQPATADTRVKVGGQPVVTQPTSYTIASCTLASTGGTPCATAQWTSAATRVSAGGTPLLLSDSQAVCTPTGTGLLVATTQLRVKGV